MVVTMKGMIDERVWHGSLPTIRQVPSFEGRVSRGLSLTGSLQVFYYRLRIDGHRCRRREVEMNVKQLGLTPL